MIDFNLYLITDRQQISRQHAADSKRSLLTVIEEALKGGVKAVQLREKDLNAWELFELAQGMRRLTKDYNAKFFINDRVDVAMSVGADGIHLGQNSFSAREVRKIFHKAIIGVSTHSVEEAEIAEKQGADFVTLGPIFYTPSKVGYGEPLGVALIKKVKREIKIPVFAIGGIKMDSINEVIQAGADGVAVISAIIGAEEPGKEAQEVVREIADWRIRD
ncbi:MAG TPA: thiamine phosphate synthase [Deltaproteobacteria bacterium]|nr:MAG: thiamine-phosphate diphosphorylase [Deltaproteobacteria bacterium GWB2_42_7]OGP41639.1 MAG: thiamine-phosphate diphosphorylase [Deltaproteobacteria bacterium GWD2_42_10]OGQ28431.1 MAG: thiamine-phosphate diphosphorylase [Deltaproteobacteria bacterium RIFCSPHIGHO2_02_FULL_42_44]OGQ38372.1 MAG: thiamine-phosphate diphosphorylase [Deltaproteobacteria bacterium RIFCSPLOWO2_02_FULL_42_39]OGQ64672.1 MAG: thiamine-phosphate diphosphorylase [Deltaproteobacteria bacterium RIFCSPLOWO2_12_FULL_42_